MSFLSSIHPRVKNTLYSVTEILSFGRGVKRTINKDQIIFPFRYSRYYPDGYEIAKQEFINNYCTGTSLDLGAHIGLYSVIMARKSKKVIAFEPTSDTRKVLRAVLKMNGISNVEVRGQAIDATSGYRDLIIRSDKISNANGFFIEGTSSTIETVSLDDLNLIIDFIKMDIEGAELLALRGATETLKTLKAMTLELHPRLMKNQLGDLEEIWDLIFKEGGHFFMNSEELTKEDFVTRLEGFEVQILFSTRKQ
jgi:FkbM family methyltransferase